MPVKFYLHPKVNKKGEAPITISINIRQTRLLTTLGYSVDPSAWDESGSVKPRYTNSKGIPARKINNRILKIKLHFAEYESELKTRPTISGHMQLYNVGIPSEIIFKVLSHRNSRSSKNIHLLCSLKWSTSTGRNEMDRSL